MTWFTIGIGIGLTLLFIISNAIAYRQGDADGYDAGFETGIAANIQKIKEDEYRIEWEEEEHRR